MYLILFLVGIVLAFAGAVLISYGAPVDASAGGLFTSGIVALVGGLIVIALALAVRVLSRIAERLEMQPLPLPPVAAVEREDPAPRPARPAPAPATAAPRASLLGWFGRASAPPAAAQKPAEPAQPAVDLAPLTRVEEPRVAPPAVVPPPPPAVTLPATAVTPPPKPAPRPPARAVANGAAEATVYKSGVIDGMAYTLYMDGSIEAELPQGKVRFASVDELQKYLTSRP